MEIKLLQNNKEINKPQSFDMFIFFESGDQVINHVPIECRANDTVAEIEEKLYKEYNEFRNTNNTIICLIPNVRIDICNPVSSLNDELITIVNTTVLIIDNT